ncbi:MAG: hypothetical protein U0487_00090 [Patescibacteria group bacterium]
MSEKNPSECSLEELLDLRVRKPWLFAFDAMRFNRIVEKRQTDHGNTSAMRMRAQGMIRQQCYGWAKRLSEVGHPVPPALLVDPCYIGDIPPWGGLPSLSGLQFAANMVLDYMNQPALTTGEQASTLS